MQRYILRFRGNGAMPPVDVERIKDQVEVTVVDESPRSLLVEAPEQELNDLIEHMPGWIIAQERMLALPDLRPHLKSPEPVRSSAQPARSSAQPPPPPPTRSQSQPRTAAKSPRRTRTKRND